MSEQATVLYNFEGLKENGEISLYEGETITIRNKNIGDGWWDGYTNDGREGLFPEAYVQLIVNGHNVESATPRYSKVPGDVNNEDIIPSPVHSYSSNNSPIGGHFQNNTYEATSRDDDTWSEDWDDSSSTTTATPVHKMPGSATQYGSLARDVHSLNSVESRHSRVSGTVSKNFNRFSSFVKHGGEDYMLGKADARVRQVDQVQIVSGQEGPSWKQNEHPFTCSIENPKQQSKMKGLKKFVCYNVTPSDTAVTVQRRYKHFDWLYARLVERYPMVAIPKLPEKQASGRFEEDFIEARMARLKLWVSYICRHPILSKSQLFRNFLTLTEQKAWKMSKRQAEKDRLSAGNFFLTVALPPTVPSMNESEAILDHFKKTTRTMDDTISQYSSIAQNLANKHIGMFKREYQSFAKAITNVSASFNLHQTSQNKTLTHALKQTGQAYHNIGEMFANQPKLDFHEMIDHLWLYKGIFETLPDVWHMQTGAIRKVKECRKVADEGRMSEAEYGSVAERADRVACCMRAEISHFHDERIRDFALAQRDMIQKQAEFFERIAGELRQTLGYFDEVGIAP